MAEDNILEFRNILKVFPGVVALKDITFSIKRGCVHVIMGENGAGKSTLMKIISGAHEPDGGELLLDGKKVSFKTPQEARENHIAMIYQELQYVPMFSVQEFLMMGREPECRVKGFIDWKSLRAQAQKILDLGSLHYDLDKKLGELSVSDIQLLEITRAISFDARIIIMDEPTSALTQSEVDRLFENIRKLKAQGITILYISHKMDEIFKIGDYITVMRDGTYIDTRKTEEYTMESLIRQMVGREISDVYPKEQIEIGKTVFEVKHYSTWYTGVHDINFHVREREILGIAGLMGAGRTELVSALFGLDRGEGTVIMDGREIKVKNVRGALKHGLMMATEDRRRMGIVGCRSILENISLPNLSRISYFGFLDKRKEQKAVSEMFQKLKIKAPNMNVAVSTLSGGNQQKVVLSKWLLSKPRVLILDDPTRGIDVSAKYEIYRLMMEMAKSGISIIMISSELPELIGMCDRVYTMYEGRFTGEISRQEFTQERIMEHMTGGENNESK
ncbi:MAG: sugar ABC transporter ATP-binding protein [Lachnospiraceae bacterium]|nr:sugar ABC transporter ATP-binding protein [Lachnospiraceae bacterium]